MSHLLKNIKNPCSKKTRSLVDSVVDLKIVKQLLNSPTGSQSMIASNFMSAKLDGVEACGELFSMKIGTRFSGATSMHAKMMIALNCTEFSLKNT